MDIEAAIKESKDATYNKYVQVLRFIEERRALLEEPSKYEEFENGEYNIILELESAIRKMVKHYSKR